MNYDNITKEHIFSAVEKIENESIKLNPSTEYDVIINGKPYPPKEVMRYANLMANGAIEWSLSGGEPTNSYLKKFGFEIKSKTEPIKENIRPTIWIMKITPGGSGNTKKYFENLFINENGKRVIGYTKEEGKIEEFWERWSRINIGDLIVVVEGFNRVFGVVEVASNSMDDENGNKDSDWFIHRRKANLIKYFKPFYEASANTNRDTIIEYSGAGATVIIDEVWNIIKDDYWNFKKNKDMVDTIELLKYKKQIILQGPPGTGKTFNAKLIAESVAKINVLTYADIIEHIPIGLSINTITNYNTFKITVNTDAKLKVQPTGSPNEFVISYDDIIKCYSEKGWLNKVIDYDGSGTGSYMVAIAKYLFDKLFSNQIKLVQFHPSYSYEDFVRGITANTQSGVVNYKTENKILGEYAADALKNYIDSRKPSKELSEEQWLNTIFDEFIDEITDFIDEKEKYPISKSAYIYGVEEDGFRYKGDNWNYNFKIPFTEIKKLYSAKVKTRQEVKKLPNAIGSARQHATYYFSIYQKFIEFIGDKKPIVADKPKTELKNFVLIIDEINRANLPAVLGELIYALEYRGEPVQSMYAIDGNRELILPPNLFIIGTMNTADRSVGHIDYAIRRRFAFIDLLPKLSVIKANSIPAAEGLFLKVAALFCKEFTENSTSLERSVHIAPDFNPTDVIIGHSYFLVKDDPELQRKKEYEIKPILREYVKDGILMGEEVVKLIEAL